MGIDVAVGAAAELQPLERRGDAAEGSVAALALDGRVRASERIPGFLVERALARHAAHFLPIVVGVAAGAVRAQPSLVRVLVAVGGLAAELTAVLVEVASGALGGQAEEGDALQTSRAGRADNGGLDQPVIVAPGALDFRMLAPQWISGLGVIEGFLALGSPE